MPDFTFPKSMRLKGKKNIEELFRNGSFFYLKPFKVVYSQKNQDNPKFKGILISVPKAKFKDATKRNRIKRIVREAFRLNKHILFNGNDDLHLPFDKIALIYTSHILPNSTETENKLKQVLSRLQTISKV